MLVDYNDLSENSKIWIYPSSRKFYPQEIEEITDKLNYFVYNWNTDKDFKASYQFLYNRFIIFCVDEHSKVSNTDIDKQVRFILKLQEQYEVELLDKMNVCFKQGEYTQYKDLKEFKKLIKNKSVNEKTIVFDNLVQNKYELKHFWEVPISESWYNRFL